MNVTSLDPREATARQIRHSRRDLPEGSRTIFFILTRRLPYRDAGFDYEAASVAKNAPRWIKALKKFGLWQQAAQPAA